MSPAPPPPPAAPGRRDLLRRAARFARRRALAAAAAAAAALARARAARAAARAARLRALALADPAAALAQVRRARRRGADARRLAEAEALLAVRAEGWAAAAAPFAALAALPPGGAGGSEAAALLARPGRGPGLALALPAPGPAALPPEAAARLALATARFGPGPPPAPLFQALPGLRCLLLTDRDLAVPGWETVRVAPPDPDPARAMLYARIHAARLLADAAPEAEASLWLDPELRVVGNLNTLLARWLMPQDLALWRHPVARDWREAVEAALLAAPPQGPAGLVALAEACEAAGLPGVSTEACGPAGGGACDTRALWRRHGVAEVEALMAAWWARAAGAPETADAAFAALIADPARLRPRILPAGLGPLADGVFLAAAPWPAAPARTRAPRPPAGGRLPVAFLYAEQYAASASTFLRAGQLAELVAEHDPERYAIAWTSDFEDVRDQVAVLAKGVLQTRSAAEIAALAARNHAVIGIWDDLIPDPERMAALDASMTLSHRQTLDFARDFPGTPAFLVTPHVNRLIRPVPPPSDRLRTGYFGELANTHRPDALADMVELVGIDTSRVETSWIDRLPEFNAHWIIRRRRPIDGGKPFLKGFLAARCGAVVIAAREDEDALAYLGDDYPFFVRGLDPAALEADMVEIAAAFGGPDWKRAQAIMAEVGARSSEAVVAAEFRAMVEAVAG